MERLASSNGTRFSVFHTAAPSSPRATPLPALRPVSLPRKRAVMENQWATGQGDVTSCHKATPQQIGRLSRPRSLRPIALGRRKLLSGTLGAPACLRGAYKVTSFSKAGLTCLESEDHALPPSSAPLMYDSLNPSLEAAPAEPCLAARLLPIRIQLSLFKNSRGRPPLKNKYKV